MDDNALPILYNGIIYYSIEINDISSLEDVNVDFPVDIIKENKCIQNSCYCAENIGCDCVEGVVVAILNRSFHVFCHCWNIKGNQDFDITKEIILDSKEPNTNYIYFPFSRHLYTEYEAKYGKNKDDYGYINDGIYEFQKTINSFMESQVKK
ncbi:hypothetical protein [Bacteroides sp. 519]|uniref:hypothetical protein n=1 Tax=Bacteroides sp. 519 TaxID=2302937 RepID=UPI0013D86D85|nr:hypothetical protein [Bacteroides sp. 519]NDV56760.1 hypothetical protein [Bacteroides sp. 519]